MLTRRFVLTGLIAAPAVIAANKLMPVHSLPERYATVWGVGHNLEVVEHVIWEPTSIMAFGMSDDIDKFREITTWEWGFPVKPMPKPINWRIDPTPDPLARFAVPVNDRPDWEQKYFTYNLEQRAKWCSSDPNDLWHPDRAKLRDGLKS